MSEQHAMGIYCAQQGGGTPVALLHGFPLDHRAWRHQLVYLAGLCRVITPDLPGFGESPGHGSFTIASLADEIHGMLEAMNALPCVLGGLSMGGYVSLAFAKKYPRDLRALILTDTRAEADTPEGKKNRDAMIALAQTKGSAAVAEAMLPRMLAPTASPSVAAEVKAIMEACPPATIAAACAAMRDREDYTDLLPKLTMPTLIIVGESDAITPPNLAEKMCKAIRGARLDVIAEAGHMSPMEQPRLVNAAIERFIGHL